jgi:hypothetical protein
MRVLYLVGRISLAVGMGIALVIGAILMACVRGCQVRG